MKYLGQVDTISNGFVYGWVADAQNFDKSIYVSLYINGIFIDKILANESRPDVKKSGIGTGQYGFSYDINNYIKFPNKYQISVYIEKTEINNSPYLLSIEAEDTKPSEEILASKALLPPGHFVNVTHSIKKDISYLLEEMNQAKLEKKPIIILPPFIDWNIPLFQRPQHMMQALARKGALCIYCSNYYLDTSLGIYELEKNLLYVSHLSEVEEYIHGAWFIIYSTDLNSNIDIIKKWKKSGNKIYYEYVDHIAQEISGEWTNGLIEKFNKLNTSLIDFFIATADELYNELSDRFGPEKILLCPNGVDVSYFQKRVPPASIISEIRKDGKPIVGYIGALAEWLDYHLIAGLAKIRKDVNFVYIGPRYLTDIRLPSEKNIFFLGKVDYEKVTSYAQYFDICFIPFKDGKIAQTTSPLKLFEYFALQKPVIVTSFMNECIKYKEVMHGSNIQELSKALDMSLLRKDNEQFKKNLLILANENSWSTRAESIIEKIKHISSENNKQQIHAEIGKKNTLLSGNISLLRNIGSYYMLDIKNQAITFGFADPVQKDDFVSLDIDIPKDYYEVSFDINKAYINNKLKDFVKYQIFCNNKLITECDLAISDTYNTFHIYSNAIIEKIELRIFILKTPELSWKAHKVWRLTIGNIIFMGNKCVPNTYIVASDIHTQVIRCYSQRFNNIS